MHVDVGNRVANDLLDPVAFFICLFFILCKAFFNEIDHKKMPNFES